MNNRHKLSKMLATMLTWGMMLVCATSAFAFDEVEITHADERSDNWSFFLNESNGQITFMAKIVDLAEDGPETFEWTVTGDGVIHPSSGGYGDESFITIVIDTSVVREFELAVSVEAEGQQASDNTEISITEIILAIKKGGADAVAVPAGETVQLHAYLADESNGENISFDGEYWDEGQEQWIDLGSPWPKSDTTGDDPGEADGEAIVEASLGAKKYRFTAEWEDESDTDEAMGVSVSLSVVQGTVSADTNFPGKAAWGIDPLEEDFIKTDIQATIAPRAARDHVQLKVKDRDKSYGGDGQLSGPNEHSDDPAGVYRWEYTPYKETSSDHSPQVFTVTITAELEGEEIGDEVEVKVVPVYTYITFRASYPEVGDESAYKHRQAATYAAWKYDIPTGKIDGLYYDAGQEEAGWYAWSSGNVTLGPNAFGTENETASIVGHENEHGVQWPSRDELPAYEWERDHFSQTHVSGEYRTFVIQMIEYEKGERDEPPE